MSVKPRAARVLAVLGIALLADAGSRFAAVREKRRQGVAVEQVYECAWLDGVLHERRERDTGYAA